MNRSVVRIAKKQIVIPHFPCYNTATKTPATGWQKESDMGKLLLFQVEDFASVKAVAGALHIKVEQIGVESYKETLQNLYHGKQAEEKYTGDVPKESMIIFCDIEDKVLDKLLAALKKKRIQVDYKAVMTATNARWNVLRIYFEMERERKEYKARGL